MTSARIYPVINRFLLHVVTASIATAMAVLSHSALAFGDRSEIIASRAEYRAGVGGGAGGPVYIAGSDRRQIVVFDGKLGASHRFILKRPVSGSIVYARDRRFAYAGSRDGWVSKIDLTGQLLITEIRVGEHLSNMALSADGRWLLAGNKVPHTLVVLKADDLSLFRVIAVDNKDARTSAVRAVYASAARQAFIVSLRDFPDIWELSWDPDAAPVYGNFVHSYRVGQEEGVVIEKQPFARRRINLKVHLEDLIFDPAGAEVIGRVRSTGKPVVYNLDARRKVADLEIKGTPHFGAGHIWQAGERVLMAVPHLDQGGISVVDMETWQQVTDVTTRGPGYFLPGNKASPYLWFKILSGPNKNVLQVLDKQSLKIIKTIEPAKDGSTAILDPVTLHAIKQLTDVKLSGPPLVDGRIIYSGNREERQR
jgi:hypothetical protein